MEYKVPEPVFSADHVMATIVKDIPILYFTAYNTEETKKIAMKTNYILIKGY